jgi:hypothetical protein
VAVSKQSSAILDGRERICAIKKLQEENRKRNRGNKKARKVNE